MNKALEKAQQKVEARNFEMRKHILKYDNVMNDQRKVVYEQRREIMNASDVAQSVADMREETVDAMVSRAIPEHAYAEQWDVAGLHEEVERVLGLELPVADWAKEEGIAEDTIRDRISAATQAVMEAKEAAYSAETMRMIEKSLLLRILDQTWKDHLLQLDHLRQGIGLRGYAQRDPLNEYKREAFELFGDMRVALQETVTRMLSHVQIGPTPGGPPSDLEVAPLPPFSPAPPPFLMEARHPSVAEAEAAEAGFALASPAADMDEVLVQADRIPRNAPCPCGSGKKYKHCHGRV
jgi:preprotein translocase subunit SecA